MAPSLLHRAGQAVLLNAMANWIGVIISLLSMVVMARLLTPDDFGVYVIALLVISLPEVIAVSTLGDALIQRKDLRPGHMNSVFVQSMVLSIAFWGLLILFAPQIERMFETPSIVPILIVTGAFLPIGALATVPAALLQRDLRYKEITAIDVFCNIAAALAGIVLAFLWKNEWALVGMEAFRRVARAGAFMFFARWMPGARSSWLDFSELFRFNFANGLSKVLQTFDSMLPKTVIGMTLGSYAVGLFNLAERLQMQAHSALVAPFAAVAMPVAAALQDNRPELHRAIEGSIRVSAQFVYPIYAGAFIIAPLAIPVVFGSQWTAAVPVFQILMVIGIRAPMTAMGLSALRGVGRPDSVAWITFVSLIAMAIFLAIAYPYGLTAIAFAILGKQVIVFVHSTWLIKRIIGLSVVRQIMAGKLAFLAASFMVLVVGLFMAFVPAEGHEVMFLIAAVLLGAAAYGAALIFLVPGLGLALREGLEMAIAGQPREGLKTIRSALMKTGA
jgi:lipopolysaccharide exporter